MGRSVAKYLLLVLETTVSGLKFAFYDAIEPLEEARFKGCIRGIGEGARFELQHGLGADAGGWRVEVESHEEALGELLRWLEQHPGLFKVAAAGHRLIHGGELFSRPILVNEHSLRQLDTLVPLAPSALPPGLAVARALSRQLPDIPQVACFDTAFHHDLPLVERYFALPHAWQDLGVRRYGFHGLSYEYIAEVLPDYLGRAADGRVVIAHLADSVSLCALHGRRSMATTMSFTSLDGVPMSTHPGSVDPGVVPYLLRQGMSLKEIEHGLHHESGLKGLSGISGDMRVLLASRQPAARLAVDSFMHHLHRALGSLVAVLGGLDALVFTGGIGESEPRIRQRLCDLAAWLNLKLDNESNVVGRGRISPKRASPSVWVIPSDESRMVAQHTWRLVGHLISKESTNWEA